MAYIKQIKETLRFLLRCNIIISGYIKDIEQLYSLSPEDLNVRKETKFVELFRRAYQKSPFYSNLYKSCGINIDDIKSLGDIKKLPVITKDIIREHPESLLTCAKWKLVENHTSGTTGSPMIVYESWPALWREQAYNVCYRKKCGFEQGKQVIASLRGHLDRNIRTLYVGLSKTLYLSSFQLNEYTIIDYYNQITKYKPLAIEGYPSSLVHFCSLLKAKGLKCFIPVVFTSSETLSPIHRSLMEEVLSAQVYDHYGTTERTIALSERLDHQGYYEVPGYSINEFEENRVITTSLINEAFPLIRYQVDDIITFDTINGERVITSIGGRNTEHVTGKDGTQFNAAALTYVAKVIPNIQNVQLIQYEIGKLDVNVVPDSDFNNDCIEKSINAINDRIGKGNMDVTINIITNQELIYSKSNKISLIVNRTKC